MTSTSLCLLISLALLGASVLPAQKRASDEIQKLTKVDPFTKGEADKMQALGVVRYGPFPWADFHGTADVDKVLGENRVLWMETSHFCIGMNLTTAALPEQQDERKFVLAECKRLNKKLRKVPAKPKKLGPWLRMHLYAQRCEQAYTEFQQLIGVTDRDFPAQASGQAQIPGKGPYLGLSGKFLLLLFQKKSDMARYMDRFCGLRVDDSMRYFHDKTYQQLLCVSTEGMEGFDASGLHGHVLYGIWQNLMNGYNGYHYPLPLWFSEGLSHYYSRQVPSRFLNVRVQDHESVSQDDQNKWALKVFRRARHDDAWFPFETMAKWAKWEEMGYQAHAQSWSRIDYLMELDREKLGAMLRKLKSVPATGDYEGQGQQLRTMAPKLLFELFELDAQAFDENWRKWVLKTYPKRKE